MELAILNFIAEHLRNPVLDALFEFLSVIGDYGFIWIAAAVVFLCLHRYRKDGIAIAIALLLALLVGNVILKNLVDRVRPFAVHPVTLLIAAPRGSSFPSGHAFTSFAAAMVLWRTDRRFGIPAMALAALISFSRVYLYVHYPTDVLAGAVLGLGVGWLAVWLVDRKKPRNP